MAKKQYSKLKPGYAFRPTVLVLSVNEKGIPLKIRIGEKEYVLSEKDR